MNKKNIVTIILCLFITALIFISSSKKVVISNINTFSQVYLNGQKIGIIKDKDKLYNLIDSNQSSIKEKYGVNTVYPPTDLKIISTNTYNANINTEEEVYNKIEEQDDFTIKGYTVNISGNNHNFKVNVLDKNIFYEAAKRFVKAFLDEDEYEKYINNNQDEIVETGRIIENMQFLENITITENYISVNDKIYTDELELSRFLLFGDNPTPKTYTVKLGDTIASVSENNHLHPEEFLIANTAYKSENTLLRVGDTVDVTLIDPQLTFVYDLYEVSDEIVFYNKEVVKDPNKSKSYNEITTPGQKGLNRVREKYSVTNGEREQGAKEITTEVLREPVTQITTIGTRNDNPYIPENKVDITGNWGWPTNKGYVITSSYGWRWGRMHQGIDISGAGNFNSPIYAVADGKVVYVYNGCPSRGKGYGDPCGGGMGNSIVIEHSDGYYTRYAHLTQTMYVKVGQQVSKGSKISTMGNSGSSTGVHLHFAVSQGTQTNYFNPMRLYGG